MRWFDAHSGSDDFPDTILVVRRPGYGYRRAFGDQREARAFLLALVEARRAAGIPEEDQGDLAAYRDAGKDPEHQAVVRALAADSSEDLGLRGVQERDGPSQLWRKLHPERGRRTTFDIMWREIVEEAEAAGPEAVMQLALLRTAYRISSDAALAGMPLTDLVLRLVRGMTREQLDRLYEEWERERER